MVIDNVLIFDSIIFYYVKIVLLVYGINEYFIYINVFGVFFKVNLVFFVIFVLWLEERFGSLLRGGCFWKLFELV